MRTWRALYNFADYSKSIGEAEKAGAACFGLWRLPLVTTAARTGLLFQMVLGRTENDAAGPSYPTEKKTRCMVWFGLGNTF